jgi:hypothetical protein
MKAIIYAGIGLFSAATVYGVVDYYNSKSSGVLDKIYQEEVPVIIAEKEIKSNTAAVLINKAKKDEVTDKKTAGKTIKKKSKKPKAVIRDFKFSNFSRGRILPSKVIEEEKTAVPVKEVIKE